MILICKHCIPDDWRAVALQVIWTAPSHVCVICRKDRNWLDLFEVRATVEDVRYTMWVNEYERGSRE